MILYICGPSGAGKTTLAQGLINRIGAMPLTSVTTRAPRPSDMPEEYLHVSPAGFDQMAKEDKFIWHVSLHGNRYGTLRKDVDRALTSGIYVPLLTLDVLKTLYAHAFHSGNQKFAQGVYLDISNQEVLRERFAKRGDKDEQAIERRLRECASWGQTARLLGVRLYYVDALRPNEEVLEDVLRYLNRPRNEHHHLKPRA